MGATLRFWNFKVLLVSWREMILIHFKAVLFGISAPNEELPDESVRSEFPDTNASLESISPELQSVLEYPSSPMAETLALSTGLA